MDAKVMFSCIALLTNKESLIFSYKTAEFIIEDVISENSFEETIEELLMQKVVEKSNTEFLYRVYTGNILCEMQSRYDQLDPKIKEVIESKKNQLGGSFEIRSIDEALMAVATKAKISGTYEEAKERYLFIISHSKVSDKTKKQAIAEYLEYILLYGKDSKDITDYKKILYRENEIQLEQQYIKSLWNVDKKGKTIAVQMLIKKEIEEVNDDNYELVAYKILYCITFYLEKYKETGDSSYRTKIKDLLAKPGDQLYKFMRQYCDKPQIELTNECKEALLLVINASCIFYKENESKLKRLKYYVDFCKKHFRGTYYDKIVEQDREVIKLLKEMGPAILKKYSKDDLLIATVTKIRDNVIQCRVDSNYIVNLFDADIAIELKRYDKIYAKIKNITRYNEVEISFEGFMK